MDYNEIMDTLNKFAEKLDRKMKNDCSFYDIGIINNIEGIRKAQMIIMMLNAGGNPDTILQMLI